MRLIPPELTSALLTALTIAGAWFATWLARRGKKEDNRIAERGQAFDQILELAASRLADITRLIAERDAAFVEREKVRESWEARWDRQMVRCRDITAPLVASIGVLQRGCTPEAARAADEAVQAVESHNLRDHTPEDG